MALKKLFICLAASLMCLGAALAAPPANPEGDWYGTLHLKNGDIHLIVHLERYGDGLIGTLHTRGDTDQNTLSDISLAAGQLSFRMKKYRTLYLAHWDDKVRGWAGTMSGGFNAYFTLVRKADYPGTRPQVPKPPLPYRVTPVTIHDGAVRLSGTLTEPEGSGPFPAALLVPASPSVTKQALSARHPTGEVLADYLTRHGLAVLRYDKRGTGKSPGSIHATTMTDQIRDATAAYRLLKARPEIAPGKVGLIGHDLGGMQAATVASQDHSVAFVVLLATPAVSGGDYFLRSTHDLAIARNALSRSDREALGAKRMDVNFLDVVYGTLTEIVKNAKSRESGMAVAEKYLKATHAPDAVAKKFVQQFFAPDFYTMLRFDPRGELQALRCPVLALSGSKDMRLNPDANQTALGNALARNQHAAIEVLPGLNHILQPANTGLPEEYGDFDTTTDPVALKRISGWIFQSALSAKK